MYPGWSSLVPLCFLATLNFSRSQSCEKISYKLIYFDYRGRGELTRLTFAALNLPFVDERITNYTQWLEMKPKTPWGVLPVLEANGKRVGQSVNIAQYLARQHGLTVFDECCIQQATVDSAADAAADLLTAFFEVDPENPEELEEFYSATVPYQMALYERFIAEHGQNGHVVGDTLSLADIAFFNILDQIDAARLKFTDYPKLKAVVDGVRSDKRIAAYLASRPKEA